MIAGEGHLDSVLMAVVRGAMQAIPAAEGGVVELIDGTELEYRAAVGTLTPHLGIRLSATVPPAARRNSPVTPLSTRTFTERLRRGSGRARPFWRRSCAAMPCSGCSSCSLPRGRRSPRATSTC